MTIGLRVCSDRLEASPAESGWNFDSKSRRDICFNKSPTVLTMKTRIEVSCHNRIRILLCVWVLSAGLTSGEAQNPSYSVVALPLIPLAVNASGQVVGYASFNDGPVHAALYSGGELTDLGTLPGGDFSEAVAINVSADIVGYSTLPGGLTHATLWSNGQIFDLGTLPGGATSSASGINDAGQITGTSDTLQPGTTYPQPDHAFLYANGFMSDLGNLSASGEFVNFSHALAINASGEVTGWSVTDTFETHAFLYANGQMTDLGTLGGSESRGTGINSAGQVVGWSYLPSDFVAHAFLVSDGAMTDLGTLSGMNSSFAVGISASGTVVGNSDSGGHGPFIYNPSTGMMDLNTLVDPDLYFLSSALAINDAGLILAEGSNSDFSEYEFLLTPSNTMDHHLANISTRLQIGTSDNVLIAGFIIQGPPGSTKKVVLRGIGPSLSGAGISNPLANPTLELHGPGGALLASNNNWKDTQEGEITATQLAPASDLESAMVETLSPGAYTAILSGVDGATGVGLVEVYDADEASAASAVNISTRGMVGIADNVMIGGLIVTGSEPVNIVARALGPSLASFGVTGALLDPILELHDANGNVTIDDNWRDTQEGEITADQLAPTDDVESAIAATLAPGAYTAIVRGKNNTSGVALIEFYQVQ